MGMYPPARRLCKTDGVMTFPAGFFRGQSLRGRLQGRCAQNPVFVTRDKN
jgi:hypothetical protein